MPGIWHQVGLHCRTVTADCPFDVTGFSFAGMPGVVIGHNARIAWGFTNLAPDVSDLYYEKVTGERYLRGTELVPLTVTKEVLKVAGGEDVDLTVRRTVHGPIISEVIPASADVGNRPVVDGTLQQGESYAVSLAWTGLVPSATADAIFQMNQASNFGQFRDAARSFAAPSQNLVYADVDGHIGYQSPGLIPIRAASTAGYPPGYLPSPGWQPQWDWQGFLAFEQLPWAFDPAEGYLVAANQQVTGTVPPFLTSDWDAGWRSQRINDLVAQSGRISPERMGQIQDDTFNGLAPTLVAALLKIDLSGDPFTAEAQSLLQGWDYTQPADDSRSSAAAAYFNAVWTVLVQATLSERLPADLRADGGGRWWLVISGLLADPGNLWWDDRRTPSVVENRDEILSRALVQARLNLTKQVGSQVSDWSWGKLHTLTVTSQVFGGDSVPSLLRRVFNRGPIPLPGGSSIVNANGWDASKGFQVTWAPSMRMVVDLGDLDASTWVNQTGNSRASPTTPTTSTSSTRGRRGPASHGRSPRVRSTPPASTPDPGQKTDVTGTVVCPSGAPHPEGRSHTTPCSGVMIPSTRRSCASARHRSVDQLVVPQQGEDRDPGWDEGQGAVVAAPALPQAPTGPIHGQAWGENDHGGADRLGRQATSVEVPVQRQVRVGDWQEDLVPGRPQHPDEDVRRWLGRPRLIGGHPAYRPVALPVDQRAHGGRNPLSGLLAARLGGPLTSARPNLRAHHAFGLHCGIHAGIVG